MLKAGSKTLELFKTIFFVLDYVLALAISSTQNGCIYA